ncbi:MAG: HAMP domain-containing sensor histidine kinase [Thermodesulfobacteriota bacterium]
MGPAYKKMDGASRSSGKPMDQLLTENALLNQEVLVARRASEITASLVVEQFVKLELILKQLEEKVATEQELRISLAEKLREAEVRERDLSKARAEAESAREDLERANESLQQLNHNYLEMLGFVSHELKNTLGVIYTSAQALDKGLTGPLNEKQGILVHNIAQNIEAAVAMTRKYLDLTRIEKGELRVQPQDLELIADVIVLVLKEMEPVVAERQVRLEVNLPEKLPLPGDPTLLRVVFRNLIGNALKYGRAGGLVRMSCRREDGYYCFEVFNEGEGLSPDKLLKLFGKFVRFKLGRESDRRGTGLGLFITKDIIVKHGGTIRAESEEGRWINFIFTLPAARQPG